MKRLINIARNYGMKLYTILSGGNDDNKITLYYKPNEEAFYVLEGDVKEPTSTKIYFAEEFPSLTDAFEQLVNQSQQNVGVGFTRNPKEYEDAVNRLIEEESKLEEKKKIKQQKQQEQEEKERARQERLQRIQDDLEQRQQELEELINVPEEEAAPTSEEELDTEQNIDNQQTQEKSDTNRPKKKNKTKNVDIKTIQFHFSENEKSLIENGIFDLSTKDAIQSYSLFKKEPELTQEDIEKQRQQHQDQLFQDIQQGLQNQTEQLMQQVQNGPVAKRSRLKRIIMAYSLDSVFRQAVSSGTIRDFIEQYGLITSMYMGNYRDDKNANSCEGFIINYNGQFIAFGKDFDIELTNLISSVQSGTGGIIYEFNSFVNELENLKNSFNLNSVGKFNDFGQAESFILQQDSNIQSKISFNESIAGKSEIYAPEGLREDFKRKEEEEKQFQQNQQSTQMWTIRINYDSNDDNKIQIIKDWLNEIYNYILPYNPGLIID